MIILRGTLPSFSPPVSSFRNGCPCSELVTAGVIVRLCFPWRSCGCGPEKQLFFGDFSSGGSRLWAVARHTSTKDPGPPRGQTGRPHARPGVQTKAQSKTSPENTVLATLSVLPDFAFSSSPPCSRSPLFSLAVLLPPLRAHASWETCRSTWFPHD